MGLWSGSGEARSPKYIFPPTHPQAASHLPCTPRCRGQELPPCGPGVALRGWNPAMGGEREPTLLPSPPLSPSPLSAQTLPPLGVCSRCSQFGNLIVCIHRLQGTTSSPRDAHQVRSAASTAPTLLPGMVLGSGIKDHTGHCPRCEGLQSRNRGNK